MIQEQQQLKTTKQHNCAGTRGYKYRNKLQIIYDLLSPLFYTSIGNESTKLRTGPGITRTRLMYRANLSYNQVNEYLPAMIKDDLVHYDDESKRFTLAPKGFEYIKRYNDLAELMPEIKTTNYT